MEFVIVGVITLIVGFVIGRCTKKPKHYGIIRVDTSDANDAPYLFLELQDDKGVYSIARERYVTFKVEIKNFITQK